MARLQQASLWSAEPCKQEERFREILEQTKDDKEKFLTERNELDEKHAFLQEGFDKLHGDYEKSRTAVAALARQIAALQGRERRARAEAEERDRRMREMEELFSSSRQRRARLMRSSSVSWPDWSPTATS